MDAFGHAAELVRERDHDRYLADLFAPETVRPHLFALHAFDSETARVRHLVSEPALGEIRLRWWRDVVTLTGEGGGNPIASALLASIELFRLPPAAFDAMLEARRFDLYSDPMPTLTDFEGYAGETTAAILQLGAIMLAGGTDPGAADAAGHAGVALRLTEALGDLPADRRRRRMFLPLEVLSAHGIDPAEVFSGDAGPGLGAALAELRGHARRHAAMAREAVRRLPAVVLPVFLPLALVEPDLRRQERVQPLQPPAPMAGWRRQVQLWRAARRWR